MGFLVDLEKLPDNVDQLTFEGRTFYVVGTAHVSRSSADLVEQVIEQIKPDTVALELCSARAESLRDPNRWRDTDLVDVIRSGKAYVLLAQLILASYQKRLADELDIKPGEEMRRAIAVTDRLQIATSNVDRDVKITLRRAWSRAKLLALLRLLYTALVSFIEGTAARISEKEIEDLKKGDELARIMEQFGKTFPGVKEILIDERDRYLATKILESPGKTVVAVVGAAHVPGIKQFFGQRADLGALEIIPPAPLVFKAILYVVPAAIIGMLIYGCATLTAHASAEMLGEWVLVSGSIAALGALLALAHPFTILAAFLSAPLVVVRAGWVCGLVEAFLRKPRVSDFETIGQDITTFRGLRSNRVTKVLLVMALSNIGALIGRLVGGAWLATILH